MFPRRCSTGAWIGRWGRRWLRATRHPGALVRPRTRFSNWGDAERAGERVGQANDVCGAASAIDIRGVVTNPLPGDPRAARATSLSGVNPLRRIPTYLWRFSQPTSAGLIVSGRKYGDLCEGVLRISYTDGNVFGQLVFHQKGCNGRPANLGEHAVRT
jgi:hypothetical protein